MDGGPENGGGGGERGAVGAQTVDTRWYPGTPWPVVECIKVDRICANMSAMGVYNVL